MVEDVNSNTFAGDFAELKLSVIRPALETVGNKLKTHGHEINISELFLNLQL